MSKELWQTFIKSGTIQDYLKYKTNKYDKGKDCLNRTGERNGDNNRDSRKDIKIQ